MAPWHGAMRSLLAIARESCKSLSVVRHHTCDERLCAMRSPLRMLPSISYCCVPPVPPSAVPPPLPYYLLLTKHPQHSMSNSASIMTAAESRRRRASSLTFPRTSCRRSIGLGLVLLLSLVGTTLAASSIPPLSVLNSRRVSAHGRDAAAAVGAAKKCHLSSQLSLLRSCRGGAAAAAAVAMPVETQEGVGPMEVFLHTIKEARRHLAAAAVARSVSIFGMYPVDTIKTRVQMELPNPLKLAGLYNGVAGSLVGQVPYGVLTFGSYEIYKEALLKRLPNVKPAFVYALSAILGDVTGSGWLCPSEVLKQKLQAGMYSNTGEALRGIWSKGGIGGFYEGYFGGLARDIPFRVAQLTSYEITKKCYLRMKERKMKANASSAKERNAVSANQLELSAGDAALCGAIAGSFSAAITSPLDRIKTLLMTDSAAYGGSVASCVGKIWREEGIRGFGAGLVPRVVYIAPSVAIFFIAYEQVQQRLMLQHMQSN